MYICGYTYLRKDLLKYLIFTRYLSFLGPLYRTSPASPRPPAHPPRNPSSYNMPRRKPASEAVCWNEDSPTRNVPLTINRRCCCCCCCIFVCIAACLSESAVMITLISLSRTSASQDVRLSSTVNFTSPGSTRWNCPALFCSLMSECNRPWTNSTR